MLDEVVSDEVIDHLKFLFALLHEEVLFFLFCFVDRLPQSPLGDGDLQLVEVVQIINIGIEVLVR